MVFLLAVLLAVVLAYYLAEPLTRKPEASPAQGTSTPEDNGTQNEREMLIQELKELELDYAGGKFAEPEYQSRKERILSRLAALSDPDVPVS